MQPYANSNIEAQTVASGASVSINGTQTIVGLGFDGATFTVLQAGLYALQASLNLASPTTAGSVFSIAVNGVTLAPSANSGTSGEITLLRVFYYDVGDRVNIINESNNSIGLSYSSNPAVSGSAGHICFYRFADQGGA